MLLIVRNMERGNAEIGFILMLMCMLSDVYEFIWMSRLFPKQSRAKLARY